MCDNKELVKELKKCRITAVTLFYWYLVSEGRDDTAEKFKKTEMRHLIE